jgi:hypothetical protein
VSSRTSPTLFPAEDAAGLAGFGQTATGHREGPNCVAKFLSEEFCVNWGHICEVQQSFGDLREKLKLQ